MDVLAPLALALNHADVRYVVIGVWGANYWALACLVPAWRATRANPVEALRSE